MELRQYIVILRRWWWLLALLTLVGGGVAFAAGELQQPVYVATTTILINQAPGALPDYNAVQQGQRVASTYAQLLQQRPVLEQVAENLGLNISPEALDGMINVIPIPDTNLLELKVQDTDPQRAADIANEVVRVFIAQNLEFQESRFADSLQNLQSEMDKVQAEITRTEARLDVLDSDTTLTPAEQEERNRLQQLLAEYRSSYATLLDRYEQIRLAQAQATDKVSVVEDALPGRRAGQSSLMLSLQGALVGLLLGVGLVVLIEYLNDTVKSKEEVEALTGLPTLGMIGNIERGDDPHDLLVTVTHPRAPAAEAYRVFRANLEFLAVGEPIRSIVVTSTGPVEGKTTTAANLAVALAQAGKRVILVDADLRRPTLHKLFQCSNSMGVSTALLQAGSEVTSHLVSTEVENLYLMPSGPLPPNPAELLGSQRAAELIRRLARHADMVILDSPPVLAVADPALLVRYCDAALLVILAEKTQAGALRRAKEQLEQAGASRMGLVLNRVPASSNGYYYYQYHYYSRREED